MLQSTLAGMSIFDWPQMSSAGHPCVVSHSSNVCTDVIWSHIALFKCLKATPSGRNEHLFSISFASLPFSSTFSTALCWYAGLLPINQIFFLAQHYSFLASLLLFLLFLVVVY